MRDGWEEISLEDLETSGVIKLGRGDVISKKDMEADPGPNPVYSSAENKNGMIGKYDKFMFDEELITWSVDGGGHIFYRPKHKFSVTNIGGWLRILDDKVFSYQFLTYALQRLHKQHSFDWQHKAHPSVIRKLYTRIPLPSLPEQKRIVDLISSVDSYIEALQQQSESAKKSRNAVLHELMYSDPNLTEVSLFEVCEFINGKAHEKNIDKHGKFILINSKFISSNGQVKKYSNKQFCPAIKDDITMVMSDLPNGKALGKCFYVSKDSTFTVNQRVCISRAKSIKPEYLFLLLDRNPYFLSFDNGVSQTNLSNRVFSDFKVKINSSQKHQAYIVDLVSNFDYVIRNSQIALVKASKLKESLLSDLLSGKYEIPLSYDKVIGAA